MAELLAISATTIKVGQSADLEGQGNWVNPRIIYWPDFTELLPGNWSAVGPSAVSSVRAAHEGGLHAFVGQPALEQNLLPFGQTAEALHLDHRL